jgi:hypothetical protein
MNAEQPAVNTSPGPGAHPVQPGPDGVEPALDDAEFRRRRAQAAHRRAEQAGVRAGELRRSLDATPSGGSTRGTTPEELTRSREHAAEADASMLLAFERGAQAHDRAARLHERQAGAELPDGQSEGHARHAREHHDAAAADRELARKARERGEPPAG